MVLPNSGYEYMKTQAVIVESLDQQNLIFIHQVVHNFVRKEVPLYMKAFRDRLAATEPDVIQQKAEEVRKYSDLRNERICQAPELTEERRKSLLDK